MILTDVRHQVNEKYINQTVYLFKGPNNETLLNYTSDTYVDVLRLLASISISIPRDEKDKEFHTQLMKSTLDMCKLAAGIRGNFLANVIWEYFHDSSDSSLTCPIKAGISHMWNFQVSDSFIPNYLLIGKSVRFLFDMNVKAKIPNVKNFVYWYSVKFVGEIIRE